MENLNRRTFLGRCAKSAGLALLGLIPGTFFSKRKLFAQTETLSAVLQSTTRSNVYTILKGSRLTPEEKLAILAVRELPRDQITKTLSMIGNFGTLARGQGQGCGNNCANSGQVCGDGCGGQQDPGDQEPQQKGLAICVLDKSGKLDISFSSLDKSLFKTALQKAFDLTR
jgi:hypothetical protein